MAERAGKAGGRCLDGDEDVGGAEQAPRGAAGLGQGAGLQGGGAAVGGPPPVRAQAQAQALLRPGRLLPPPHAANPEWHPHSVLCLKGGE